MLKKIYTWFHNLTSPAYERGEYSSGYWQDIVRRQALFLCRDLKGRLLEVGCGEGLFLARASAQNPDLEIQGVDNNASRLEKAGVVCKERKLNNISLSLEDAGDLSFADGSFDAVVCINVFFNLDSFQAVREVMIRLKHVCKNGGRIIFDFRNSLNPLLKVKYRLARYYDPTVKALPLNTYSPGQIESLVKELGLNIIRRRYVGFALRRFAPIIIIETQKVC